MDDYQTQKENPIHMASIISKTTLEKNYAERALRNCHMSVYYFSHRFKEETGFSPMDYVINTRLEKAKMLLVRTTKTVAEIAYEVGYGSSGSFINIFNDKVGCSPKTYRRLMKI